MSQTNTKLSAGAQNGHPYDKYEWRKNADGVWQRNIDEAELFYASICRQADDPEAAAFAITGSASFSVDAGPGPDVFSVASKVEESLRSAWEIVRFECPAVASWTAYDARTESWKRLCSPIEDALDGGPGESKRLSDTFKVVETDLSEKEWFNTEPPVYRLPTLFLVRPKTEVASSGKYQATVCFRAPHDVIDGHGILQLLDLLFAAAADAYNGVPRETKSSTSPPQSLAAPFRVACSVAPTPSETQVQYFKDTFVKNASMSTELPPLGLPTNVSPGAPSKRKRVATSLPKPVSADILRECKLQGLTVTHAISAGVVLALRSFQEDQAEPKTLRWYMQGLLSLRYLCQRPYSTIQHAAGNYHAIATRGLGLDVEVSTKDRQSNRASQLEFSEMAAKIRDYYAGVRPPKDLSERNELDVAPITWKVVTPAAGAKSHAEPTQEGHSPASIAVSSLGNISSMIKAERKPFVLTNVWVAGEGQGSATPLMLGGWDGQVELSAIFDEAYFSEDYMIRFQQAVLTATTEGLGI